VSSFFLLAVLTVGICAFIGWITNAVAIKMIFRPYEPVRIVGPIQWQSILVRHAGRFARDVADMITQEFFTLRDLAVRIEPALVHETLDPILLPAIDAAFAKFVAELPPEVTASGLVGEGMLTVVKQQLLQEIDRMIPEVVDLVVQRIDALVDLHAEIVNDLTGGNVGRLEDLIMTVVGKEFRWIEYYGGIFGAVFGLFGLALRSLGLTGPVVLPPLGVVVGLATNWIAIAMLFSPREPLKFGFFTLQGVFPARQQEIAMTLAMVVEQETQHRFGEMLDLMVARGFAVELRAFVVRRLDGFLQSRLEVPLLIVAAAGAEVSPARLAEDVIDQVTPELPRAFAEIKALAEARIDIAGIVRAKLEGMDKLRFEAILRGLVKQDEGALVVYGGLLGGIIGIAQVAVSAPLW
jgi:uncharacterized membrane protein YheB (UPF0754 family)